MKLLTDEATEMLNTINQLRKLAAWMNPEVAQRPIDGIDNYIQVHLDLNRDVRPGSLPSLQWLLDEWEGAKRSAITGHGTDAVVYGRGRGEMPVKTALAADRPSEELADLLEVASVPMKDLTPRQNALWASHPLAGQVLAHHEALEAVVRWLRERDV